MISLSYAALDSAFQASNDRFVKNISGNGVEEHHAVFHPAKR